jgi:HlyD family secretion protein
MAMVSLNSRPKSVLSHPDISQTSLQSISSDDLLPRSSNWLTIAGLGIVGAIVISVGFAAFAKYNVTVKADAIVRPSGDLRTVQSEHEGSISYIAIKENQTIKQGDVIAVLDQTKLTIKKNQLEDGIKQLKLQLTQVDNQIRSLQTQIQAETQVIAHSVKAIKADLVRNERDFKDRRISTRSELLASQANLEKAKADLRKAQMELRFAQQERDRYATLLQERAISQQDFDKKNQLVSQLQASLESEAIAVNLNNAKIQTAGAAVNPSNANIVLAQEKVAQEKSRGDATLASLEKDLQVLSQHQTELNSQLQQQMREYQQIKLQISQSQIRATHSGLIFKLNLKNNGQYIHPGDEIAKILPQNIPLFIKAKVSSQDIQKVNIGQRTQMRITACPYPDYGLLEGKVSSVASDMSIRDPKEISDANFSQNSLTYFEVLIQPNILFLSAGDKICKIQPGMTATLDIITQEETILRFLLRQMRLQTKF